MPKRSSRSPERGGYGGGGGERGGRFGGERNRGERFERGYGGGGGKRQNQNSYNPFTSSSSSCSVFVGNLKYETRWQELKDHMRKAGNVDSVRL